LLRLTKRIRARARWWRPRLAAALLGLALGALLAAAAGLTAARHWSAGAVWARRWVAPDCRTEGDPLLQRDDWLGSALTKNAATRERCRVDGRELYDVWLHTDALGRRVTPQTAATPESFVAILGCSLAFGMGLRDDETIAARLARTEAGRTATVYNYGAPGWGPNEILALLSSPEFAAGVKERRGAAVLVYHDGMIARAIGSLAWLRCQKYPIPCYEIDAAGRLTRAGLMDWDRPPRTHYSPAEAAVHRTYMMPGYDWPPAARPAVARFAAQLIEEAARAFLQRFPTSEFYLAVYPENYARGMRLYFAPDGPVQLLDLSHAFDNYRREDMMIPIDGHPSALAAGVFAEALAKALARRQAARPGPV